MGSCANIILDSGDRTKFNTGAVRDMRTGKGRFDLVPIEVMCNYFKYTDSEDKILTFLREFILSNYASPEYLYMALEAFRVIAYQYSAETMFLEVAKHFEDGAAKYGENNWQKGIPPRIYIDSAIRHYMKWRRQDEDEPHDRAFVWNIICCAWEVEFHKIQYI